MDVRNCKNCGRLFNYMGGQAICQQCKQKLEEKFQEVKEYLDENPHATISRVSEEMEVSTKQIKQWIKEERLSLSEATADGVVCEHCGKPIRSGRYCDKCKIQLQDSLSSAIKKPKQYVPQKTEKTGNRMRFLQKE